MSSPMHATFSTLPNGVWGIRVVGGVPQPGDVIEVLKRSGARKRVTVSEILSTTAGETVCAIEGASKVGKRRGGFRRFSIYRTRCEDAPCCGCCG